MFWFVVYFNSISKVNSPYYPLNSSIDLSRAFQLNDSCLKAGPPCLRLCTSPTLATLVPDVGPMSTSLSAIIATVDAWIATCMIVVWIAPDSDFSACIS